MATLSKIVEAVLDCFYMFRAKRFVQQKNYCGASRIRKKIKGFASQDMLSGYLAVASIQVWDFDGAREIAEEMHKPYPRALVFLEIAKKTKNHEDFMACGNARLAIPKSDIRARQYVLNELLKLSK